MPIEKDNQEPLTLPPHKNHNTHTHVQESIRIACYTEQGPSEGVPVQ